MEIDPQHVADKFLRVFNAMAQQGHFVLASNLRGLCRATTVDDNLWDAISFSKKPHLDYALRTCNAERVEFLCRHAFWAEPYMMQKYLVHFLPRWKEILPILKNAYLDLSNPACIMAASCDLEVLRYIREQIGPFKPVVSLYMCWNGEVHPDVYRFAFQNGAHPNYVNMGQPVLHAVIKCEHESLEVCRAFIEAGANVNTNIAGKDTPLVLAVKRGIDHVKLLCENGADVNYSQISPASTALQVAVALQDAPIVEYLLSCGADPNSQGMHQHNSFPLEIAVGLRVIKDVKDENSFNIIKMLVRAGANVNPAAGRIEKPMRLAVKHGDTQLISYLASVGANFGY